MELRFYAFVNFYLSSIQQGIQTGHASVDLVRKYHVGPDERRSMVNDWADNHKTYITLNGGNNKMLHNVRDAACNSGYPWVTFYEDEDSLGGILTCVGVVLPEDVFNASPAINSIRVWPVDANKEDAYEYRAADGRVVVHDPASGVYPLLKILKSSRLAS